MSTPLVLQAADLQRVYEIGVARWERWQTRDYKAYQKSTQRMAWIGAAGEVAAERFASGRGWEHETFFDQDDFKPDLVVKRIPIEVKTLDQASYPKFAWPVADRQYDVLAKKARVIWWLVLNTPMPENIDAWREQRPRMADLDVHGWSFVSEFAHIEPSTRGGTTLNRFISTIHPFQTEPPREPERVTAPHVDEIPW